MEMNIGILVGVLTGIVIGIFFLIIFFKLTKKDGSIKCKFDERQELVRGRGFKYSFFTLVIYDAFIAFLSESLALNRYMDSILLSLIGIFTAVLIYVSYCIWNEGYFSLNENPKKVLIGFAVIALFNFIIGFMNIKENGMFENGVLTYRCTNFLCGIIFLIIFAELLLKRIIIKAEEE